MINVIEVKGLGMRVDKDVYEEVRQETGYSGERLIKELERVYEGVLEREVDRCAEHHLKTVKNAMWRFIKEARRYPKTVCVTPFGTGDGRYARDFVTQAVQTLTKAYKDLGYEEDLNYLIYGE
jgi:hypothetical protein